MARYINKADVVSEIERLREEEYPCDTFEESTGYYNALDEVSSFLNTLEVKDVDEIIKNAEDHAYFAGSENTREKLIDKACKWWEDELSYPSMTPEEIKWYKNKVRKFRKAMEDEK